MPHHSKTKALTTTNVTLQRTIEVSNTGDKKVTPPIKIAVDAPTSTKKDLSLQLHLIRNNEVIIITHGYIFLNIIVKVKNKTKTKKIIMIHF